MEKKIDMKEMGLENVDWIYFSQDIIKRRAVVKRTMNFRVSKYAGNFVTNERFTTSPGLCSIGIKVGDFEQFKVVCTTLARWRTRWYCNAAWCNP
jgi:hypothetical protein